MRLLFVAYSIAAAVACVRSATVVCGDGQICPAGDRCDLVHQQCVSEAQTTVCLGTGELIDGDRCMAAGFAGICDQEVCIAGCGDGVQLAEECDDGNLKSHDGCSSRCTLERPVWSEWRGAWGSRARHVAAYHAAAHKLVVVGGTDDVSALADVWERDDAGRWTRHVVPQLSGRFGASMAYDPQRGRIVLFGGTADATGQVALNETWIYDGENSWTRLPPQANPPEPRFDAAMAYVGNGEIVVFGGRTGTSSWLSDTWKFDGSTWTQVTQGSSPPGRFGATMVWAPFSGSPRAVLSGGYGANGNPTGGYLGDHWEYTSSGWQLKPAIAAPTVRRFASTAFVSNAGPGEAVVLFGGALNMVPNDETWRFDGTTWALLPSAPASLSPRSAATLTVGAGPGGAGAQALYLIGGSGVGAGYQDIWSFGLNAMGNAYVWSELSNPGRAQRRSQHAIVYDLDRGVIVTIGGFGAGVETALFDGATWQSGATVDSRIRASAAYDSLRKRIVVFGGGDANAYETLLFDANTGWDEPGGMQPPARRDPAMAFDANLGKVVLFGGQDPMSLAPRGDTWVFDTQWTQRSFTGPAPSMQAGITYDATRKHIVLYDDAGTTWTYAESGWTQLVPGTGTGPGARIGPGLAFSKELDAVVMYGGIAGSTIKRDMWRLTEAGWVEIPVTGELPLPRHDVRMVASSSMRALVLHGGRTTSDQNLDDTWLFQYRSTVPDEDCDLAGDEDGDKRVNELDPDCQ